MYLGDLVLACFRRVEAESTELGSPPPSSIRFILIGDEVAYLDEPEFAKFWDQDAQQVESRCIPSAKYRAEQMPLSFRGAPTGANPESESSL